MRDAFAWPLPVRGAFSKLFWVNPCFASSVLDMEENGRDLVYSTLDDGRSLPASGTSKADLVSNALSPPLYDQKAQHIEYKKFRSF